MARPLAKSTLRRREVAERLGVPLCAVLRHSLDRPMSEDARKILVNEIRHTHEAHNDPIVVGRGGVTVSSTDESLTITIRKKPLPESAETLAIQRAGRRA